MMKRREFDSFSHFLRYPKNENAATHWSRHITATKNTRDAAMALGRKSTVTSVICSVKYISESSRCLPRNVCSRYMKRDTGFFFSKGF